MSDTWIDALADIWKEVTAGGRTNVKSYRLAEIPDAITIFPSAISYVTSVDLGDYGTAHTNIDIYHGLTEFHLFSTVALSNLQPANLYMKRIETVAKAHVGLGGLVHWFMLEPQDSISLVEFEFDNSPSQRGLLVKWVVKEDTSQSIPVSA
jgi:hypothetical protein